MTKDEFEEQFDPDNGIVMELDDLIELFIQHGIKAYKRIYRSCPEGRALDRHETVTIHDVEFNYWRELSVYKMAEYLQELIPTLNVEVNLDGNNSNMKIEINDDDYTALTEVLTSFLKEQNLL